MTTTPFPVRAANIAGRRPEILRGLAEAHSEYAAAVEQWGDATGRETASTHYTELNRLHPTWCQRPMNPGDMSKCGDEALYYAGYELLLASRVERRRERKLLNYARHVWKKLLRDWSTSGYASMAIVGIGETFVQEAGRDPTNWVHARFFYDHALRQLAPANPVWGYAAYRTAESFAQECEFDEAREYLNQVIVYASTYPSEPQTEALRQAARSALRELSEKE